MRIGKEKKRVVNPKRFVPKPIPVELPQREKAPVRERESVPVERPERSNAS